MSNVFHVLSLQEKVRCAAGAAKLCAEARNKFLTFRRRVTLRHNVQAFIPCYQGSREHLQGNRIGFVVGSGVQQRVRLATQLEADRGHLYGLLPSARPAKHAAQRHVLGSESASRDYAE